MDKQHAQNLFDILCRDPFHTEEVLHSLFYEFLLNHKMTYEEYLCYDVPWSFGEEEFYKFRDSLQEIFKIFYENHWEKYQDIYLKK